MMRISNEVLLETYYKALRMKLEEEFIHILLEEIKKRNLVEQLHLGAS